MMSMKTTSAKSGTSPCGCGGSGGGTASPCACGSVECSTCLDQGYRRPWFFAGQLLTEDDLQQLGDYMLGKNRLHNRYLMGSGVVCGMEVTCHPCGGGRVIVHPGYAIDCCGNDVVMSCPQELDINKMVNDLRLKLHGGYDCGDPCKDVKPSGNGTGSKSTPNGASPSKNGNQHDTKAGSATEPPHRHKYCLYINYCEQPAEPVAPYTTDEPCAPVTCEPTRIREGFSFELRCPEKKEAGPEICRRLWACRGDAIAHEKITVDADYLRPYERKVLLAVRDILKNPTLKVFDHDQLTQYWKDVSSHTTDTQRYLGKFQETPSKENLQPCVDALTTLAEDVAHFTLQDRKTQETYFGEGAERRELFALATNALQTAHKIMTLELIEKASPTALERPHLQALFDVVTRLLKRGQGAITAPVPPEDLDLRFIAEGVAISRASLAADLEALHAMREYLLDQLKQPQKSTSCDLPRKVEQVTLSPRDPQPEFTLSTAGRLAQAGIDLTRAVRYQGLSCQCNALNPPCPPCDDQGVLLACLTVEECQVGEICNLERDFVLSPVAVRYWIPAIQILGEQLEELCCPALYEECIEETTAGQIQPISRVSQRPSIAGGGIGPPPINLARLALLAIEGACRLAGKARGPVVAPPRSMGPIERLFASLMETKYAPAFEEAVQPVPVATTEFERKLNIALNEIANLKAEVAGLPRPERGGREKKTPGGPTIP